MKSSINNLLVGLGLVGFGVAIGVAGIYIGDTDDAPGAALRHPADDRLGGVRCEDRSAQEITHTASGARMAALGCYFMPSFSPFSSRAIDSLTRRSFVSCRFAVTIQPMNCFWYENVS